MYKKKPKVFITRRLPKKIETRMMELFDTTLNEKDVLSIAGAGDEAGCYEALFTLGDKPELKWDFALTQLEQLGFSSTHDYLISSMKKVNDTFK